LPRLGPYSEQLIIGHIDGRTKEARLCRSLRKALIEQLGGADRLTPTQRVLIERAVMLTLRVSVLDQRLVDGTLTGYDNATFIAWSNALRRTLVALGLEAPGKPSGKTARYLATRSSPAYLPHAYLQQPERQPSLADYIASKSTAA
jgi:hypothetical protein